MLYRRQQRNYLTDPRIFLRAERCMSGYARRIKWWVTIACGRPWRRERSASTDWSRSSAWAPARWAVWRRIHMSRRIRWRRSAGFWTAGSRMWWRSPSRRKKKKISRLDTGLYRNGFPIKTRYVYASFSLWSNETRTMSETPQFKIRHRASSVCVDTCSFLRIRWSWPELKW